MAAPSELTPDLLDIAATLTIDDVPPKLRCGSCNLLAINSFRMPCCDQIICGNCRQNLGQACPICLHEPVDAEDCKPNKALRTTVKVWLKKRGTEREAAERREMASRAPATPAASVMPALTEAPNQQIAQNSAPSAAGVVEIRASENPRSREASETQSASGMPTRTEGPRAVSEAQEDIPKPSIELGDQDVQSMGDGGVNGNKSGETGSNELEYQQQSEDFDDQQKQQKQLYDQWMAMGGSASAMNNGGLGFDGMNGGFPSMGFNTPAEFNQMMQFMPSGMQNNLMGALPNMMSMPGMGFDPMTMAQGMYGSYNGQGIGMNGMNAGMGFANGQGAYGGYNGQATSWNAGQNNYNQNAYGGHANGMTGDFGSNSGYGGYKMPPHQGNFNQVHPRQFPNNDFQHGYHGSGFQNRGRGRGRGYQNAGRGRGAYNQVNSGYQANYEPSHQQSSAQIDAKDSDQQQFFVQPLHSVELRSQQDNSSGSTHDVEGQKTADDIDMAKELLPGDAEDVVEYSADPNDALEEAKLPNGTDESPQNAETEASLESRAQTKDSTKNPPVDGNEAPKTSPIETFVPSEPAVPEANNVAEPTVPTPSTAMLPPPNPAIPTGPAALHAPDQSQSFEFGVRGRGRGYHRGSFDSRGGPRGRGSTHLTNGHSAHVPNGHVSPALSAPSVVPLEPKGLGVEGAPKGPKALREGLPNTGIRGGRGFAIVGRASAAAHARVNGHARSKSPSPTRSRSRSPHRPHHHRSYRHRSIDSSYNNDRDEARERHHRRSRKHVDEGFSDDQESRTAESTSKRSSRRHREDDRDKEPTRSSHRSHRSHRDRSHERDGEHRSSRRRSRSPENSVDQSRQINGPIPTSPRAHKRKERDDEPTLSSRKRRERDEEDQHRERKRSKPDPSEPLADGDGKQRSKRSHRDVPDTYHNEKAQRAQSKATGEEIKAAKIAQPQLDAHTREREARNAERLQKEMQRRQKQLQETESKVAGPKRRDSRVSQGGRRVSYKYEDEESNEARASRVESEREASRWG